MHILKSKEEFMFSTQLFILCPKWYQQHSWHAEGVYSSNIIMEERSCMLWHYSGELRSWGWRCPWVWSSMCPPVLLILAWRHRISLCADPVVFTRGNEDMGLWMVEPDTDDRTGNPHLAIIHLNSIYQAVHVLPVHRNNTFIEHTITMHTSLDTFKLFYINKFVDHQLFEVLS